MTRDVASFADRIAKCWSSQTASTFTIENPARGQCSVTALVGQYLLGGEILKTKVSGAWHYYNRIEGRRVDFTMSQFTGPIVYDDIVTDRKDALSDTSVEQYQALLSALKLNR